MASDRPLPEVVAEILHDTEQKRERRHVKSGREMLADPMVSEAIADAGDIIWEGVHDPKQTIFLNMFAVCGMVRHSCRSAGVHHSTVYQKWMENAEFAKAFETASKKPLLTLLEDEAIRRAVFGTEEPIIHQGIIVGTKISYSDILLNTLLKAAAPEKYATSKLSVEATLRESGQRKTAPVIPTDEERDQAVARMYRLVAQIDDEPEVPPDGTVLQ